MKTPDSRVFGTGIWLRWCYMGDVNSALLTPAVFDSYVWVNNPAMSLIWLESWIHAVDLVSFHSKEWVLIFMFETYFVVLLNNNQLFYFEFLGVSCFTYSFRMKIVSYFNENCMNIYTNDCKIDMRHIYYTLELHNIPEYEYICRWKITLRTAFLPQEWCGFQEYAQTAPGPD